MKHIVFSAACLLAVLSGCSQQSKESCCGKCCDKDSMEVVMDLHRKVKPECVAAFKASFAKCKESTVLSRAVRIMAFTNHPKTVRNS